VAGRRVVVIGSGIVGLCAADALASRGFEVTVLERDREFKNACSFGNGGLIVPSHFEPLAQPGMIRTGLKMLLNRESPFGIRGLWQKEVVSWLVQFMAAGTTAHVERCAPILRDMNLGSRRLFEERFINEALRSGYERQGELMVCRTAAGLSAEAHLGEKANKIGLKTRLLNRDELAKFETGINYEAEGAVYFEDDAHLTPATFMPLLRQRVINAGVAVQMGQEVSGFRVENGKVLALRTTQAEVEADEFVVAAGSWTGELVREAGLDLPLLAGKGYGFTVANPPQTPKYPAILTEARVAVTPMQDGVRFVGTMELGLTDDRHVNPARLRGMKRSIGDFYPAFRGDVLQGDAWCGLRPCAPDGMPYLGRSARLPNLTLATGHGMMGMSLGPISGELVAEIISGEKPSIPLALLSPDRYG